MMHVRIGHHSFCISSLFTLAGLLLLLNLLLLHAYSCFWPLIAFVENTAILLHIFEKRSDELDENN